MPTPPQAGEETKTRARRTKPLSFLSSYFFKKNILFTLGSGGTHAFNPGT